MPDEPKGTNPSGEPKSEAVERPWASNDKLTYDVTLAHINRVHQIAEQELQNAVSHTHTLNVEHEAFVAALHNQYLENNRYTLDRLYSVFPEEAVGISTMVTTFLEILKQTGWQPPTTQTTGQST